eukprot:scaffold655_cov105-Isochrysis_galbana.AAC.2
MPGRASELGPSGGSSAGRGLGVPAPAMASPAGDVPSSAGTASANAALNALASASNRSAGVILPPPETPPTGCAAAACAASPFLACASFKYSRIADFCDGRSRCSHCRSCSVSRRRSSLRCRCRLISSSSAAGRFSGITLPPAAACRRWRRAARGLILLLPNSRAPSPWPRAASHSSPLQAVGVQAHTTNTRYPLSKVRGT